MRAYALEAFDVPPRFMEVPEPVVRDGEVLVRVQATSVNPADQLVASGVFRDKLEYRFPAVFGRDVAGVVEQVGGGVDRLESGDEVFGFIKREYIGDGAFAPYVVVPADRYVVRRPTNVSTLEAGALGLASVTALQCLDVLQVTKGGTVFVNGATGGVGSFAVQIGRALGAHVIATARPGAEETHVRELGADETIDWSASDVGSTIRERYPGGVDALLDLISDRSGFPALAKRVIAAGGRGATTRVDEPEAVAGLELVMVHSTAEAALLERIVSLVESGKVHVPVTHSYEFDDIPVAFEKLRGGVIGKIAVSIAT